MISTVERSLDEKLLCAFLNTRYLVQAGGEQWCVRIGQTHPALDMRLGQPHWATFTASNPAASQLSDRDNQARNQALAGVAQAAGVDSLPAINRAPDAGWPDEHGLLLIAPEADWLVEQARAFDQYGLVFGRSRQAAELWLFAPCPAASAHGCVRVFDL